MKHSLRVLDTRSNFSGAEFSGGHGEEEEAEDFEGEMELANCS